LLSPALAEEIFTYKC